MKRCPKCGEEKPTSEFYAAKHTKDGFMSQCKECHKAGVKAYEKRNPKKRERWQKTGQENYNKRHPERRKEITKRWRERHPEQYQAGRQRYRDNNRERIAAAWKAYYATNADALSARRLEKYDAAVKRANRKPGQSRKDRERRRARLLDAFVADVEFDVILLRDEGRCGICNQPILEPPELDHILPLAAGGTHEPDNVQLAHLTCNRKKGPNRRLRGQTNGARGGVPPTRAETK